MRRRLILLVAASLVSPTLWMSQAESAPVADERRLGGLDRFETAALVAKEVVNQGLGGSNVILASGLNYPDALVGGAWVDPSVVLLTKRDEIPASIKKILADDSVSSVRIIGGTAVISVGVENEVRALGKTVERLAGPTRYDTSLEVFKAATQTRKSSSLWIASGVDFPDQLVAVSAARRVGGAVVIVPPWKAIDSRTASILRSGLEQSATIHVVDSARALESVTLDGFRVERHINDPYVNSIALQAGTNERTYVASGENWPDALAASRLVTENSRLLLSKSSCSPESIVPEVSTSLETGKATLIGGPVAIGTSESLRKQCSLGEIPVSLSRDNCRIKQFVAGYESSDYRGGFSTAFPFDQENHPPTGLMRILVIPVDWANHQGTLENLRSEQQQVWLFTELYSKLSEGRIQFQTTFPNQWYRLSEPVENYPQDYTSYFNTKLAQHAVDLVDPFVDFSNVDLVILAFPDDPPIPVTKMMDAGFGSAQNFNNYVTPGSSGPMDWRAVFSEEGFVRNYVAGGQYFDDPLRPVWSYYVHEVGHVISLPDWYLRAANYGPEFEAQKEYATGPMSHWDAMSSQDGPSRTFSSWTRWLLGWLGEERVLCLDTESIQHAGSFEVDLLPLDLYESGTKTIIVRTGEYEGLVIESRRPVFPDHDLVWWRQVGREPYGLIVYRVDATKGNSEGTLSIVPPKGQGVAIVNVSDRFDPRLIDGLYNLGAVGVVDDLQIQLVRSGDRDTVRITSLGG